MATDGSGEGFPDGLGARGRRLWHDLGQGEQPAAERVLIEEIARLVDRLDRLDQALADDATWLTLEPAKDGAVVRVVVTGVLAEARQQQATLKQLLAELRQRRDVGEPAGKKTTETAADSREGVAGVTDLATWTPARSPKATG